MDALKQSGDTPDQPAATMSGPPLARIGTSLGIGVPPSARRCKANASLSRRPAPIERSPELPSLVQISGEAQDARPLRNPLFPTRARFAARANSKRKSASRGSAVLAPSLIFCVAFVFKYAVDNQWIGETGRVMLGILAGLACLGIGDRIWRAGHQTYAQSVCGLGIAVLYLSFYASFGFYHLLAQSVAFALMALTTAFSVRWHCTTMRLQSLQWASSAAI